MTRNQYLSVQEAASILGLTHDETMRLIHNGLLTRYRLRGRYLRVRAGQVQELLDLPREWLRMS